MLLFLFIFSFILPLILSAKLELFTHLVKIFIIMDIVLDSNIFRADILLRSKEFDILLDYLDKTGSLFVMPQIILDEIKGLYKRTLIERLSELKKASNNIN